jgi:hypothetical protein
VTPAPNPRVNRTTRELRSRVPSSLRSSVAGYAPRSASTTEAQNTHKGSDRIE